MPPPHRARFGKRVAPPSAPQPQCRVAPPITVALAELGPSLTFELLQGRQDLLPCHPGSQTLKGRLFARIGPNALAQLAGETLAAQYIKPATRRSQGRWIAPWRSGSSVYSRNAARRSVSVFPPHSRF